MTTIKLEPFLAMRRHLEIVHHVPGRIRVRVTTNLFNDVAKVDSAVLDRVLGAIDGIEDVRVNRLAGSAVISYDTRKIQSSWWATLLTGDEDDALALLRSLLDTTLAPAVQAAREE